MATNGNDAAFARPQSRDEVNGFEYHTDGLTKREYFAAVAMQGLVSRMFIGESCSEGVLRARMIAQAARLCADALIDELNKPSRDAQ